MIISNQYKAIESSAEGVVVDDGSITMPDFSLLLTPVELEIHSSRVVEFRSENTDYMKRLNQLLSRKEIKNYAY